MSGWTSVDNRILDSEWYTSLDYLKVLKRLRDEDPVHWTEDDAYGKHYWYLTRYDDVKTYFADHAQLSNRIDTKVPRLPRNYTPEERYASGFYTSMARNDPPVHDLYRRPLNRHFSVPAVNKLKTDIERIVDEIIDEISELGECDIVKDAAGMLPAKVILRMLGVPEEDWLDLKLAAEQWLTPAQPGITIGSDPVETSTYGLERLMTYCERLALDRRAQPTDDFATVIGNMKVDGEPLSIYEMRSIFVIVIAGGLESTRNAASVGLWLFLTNPDQRQLLLDDPSLINSAIDESLRWITPSKTRLRVASADFELGGKQIRNGDWVVASQVSANHDERVFADPDRFDITRDASAHLAFGDGIHKCLGRTLVRLELATFLPKMLKAFPDMRPTSEPTWIADYSVGGFSSLPVAYTAAPIG